MMGLWWALACGTGQVQAPVDLAPAAIGLAECAVCGMTVSEQLAPRGQVVYRDGTHHHVCSVQELRALAQSPSPRGAPVGIYVEALPSDFDLQSTDKRPQDWLAVDQAYFVYGAERPLVMGTPALSFRDEASARAVAHTLQSKVLRWSDLEQTPFHTVPEDWRTP